MTGVEMLHLAVGVGILAFYVTAIYVAWRALFRDPHRGRRRCPRCWHDLTGTPGMTCSECGFHALHEKQLRRARRRWAVAVLSIVACVGMAGFLNVKLEQSRGWTQYVPTRVLVTMLPMSRTSGDVYKELTRRVARRGLESGQWSALVRRSARGDWWNRPPGDDWIDKYGMFLGTWRWQVFADEELEWDDRTIAAVLAIPPRLELTTREVWPTGSTVSVNFTMRDWWPMESTCRIEVTPRLPGAEPIRFYRRPGPRRGTGYDLAIPGVPADAVGLELDVAIARETGATAETAAASDARSSSGAGGGGLEWETVSEQTFALDLSFANVPFEPLADETLDDVIRGIFRGGVVRWPTGPSRIRFMFQPQGTYLERYDDTAIGIHADLMHGDTVVRRLDIWWRAGAGRVDRRFGSVSYDVSPELFDTAAASEGWVLRVTGDRDLALRAGDLRSYWDGEVTIPVASLTQNDDPATPRTSWSENAGN